MEIIEKIKNYSWAIMLVFMCLLFLRQCGVNRDIDKIQKDVKETRSLTDSLKVDVSEVKTIERKDIREEMEQVMFQYLIYEDDLDKGKVSLSDIRNKIKEDE